MTRMRMLFASLLFSAGCSSAYADQPYGPQPPNAMVPQTAIAIANAKVRAPYDVQVIEEDGDTSPTFAQKDRFYVLGQTGKRYTIRITNPTARRVEAVVTVDGLDVVDGEAGDLRKRGYIVPAYGEVRIEGFRTSTTDVATFRFSSVNDSYAGQKGKARNVGVIAAAIFEEDGGEQQIIVADKDSYRRPPNQPYDYRNDIETRGGGDAQKRAPEAERPTATRPSAPPPPPGAVGGVASRAPRPPVEDHGGDSDEGYYEPAPKQQNSRPGLGTEFGEQRYSAATFTKFTRKVGQPVAIAELRYNDAAGLTALGIPVAPMPDSGEIMTRETADPFPGDGNFARPPGRR